MIADGRETSPNGDGFFLGVSLLDEVTPDMDAYKDEIFGPVLSVVRAKTYDDAVQMVNDNPYGNGVAIFTRDGGAARQFQFEAQAGMVGINVPIPVPVAYYSFGGWKSSLSATRTCTGPRGSTFIRAGRSSRPAGPTRPRARSTSASRRRVERDHAGRQRRLRHQPSERELEFSAGDPELVEAVSDHLERSFGAEPTVFHEVVSDLVHVDVHLVPPDGDRAWTTLVTSGLAERPMTVPEGLEEHRFAELVLACPRAGLSMEASSRTSENYWPIRLLKMLARSPTSSRRSSGSATRSRTAIRLSRTHPTRSCAARASCRRCLLRTDSKKARAARRAFGELLRGRPAARG